MKKTTYYRAIFTRENKIKVWLLTFLALSCSMPRMLLEVFVRKNFGRRYFVFSVALFIALLLAATPVILPGMFGGYSPDLADAFKDDPAWYLFIVAFLFFSYKREREIDRTPAVFDMTKFTKSPGERLAFFSSIKVRDKYLTPRQAEIYAEPLLFFASGLLLYALSTALGVLIMICSILYSISYMEAYYWGDTWIMDQIDELICAEESRDILHKGKSKKGVPVYLSRKVDPTKPGNDLNFFDESTDDEDDDDDNPAVLV